MSEDEEEKGARSSDDSGSSEDEQNDDDTSDWEIYEYQNLHLERRTLTNPVSNLPKYLIVLMAYIGS